MNEALSSDESFSSDRWWGQKVAVVLLTLTVIVPLVYVPTYYGAVVGKAVVYRILVEMALVLWLAGLVTGPIRVDWRKLLDPVGGALAVFTVWGTIGSLLGYGPLHSLFGEITRMWGAITWWHLLAFYVMARTTFREADWRRFFGWAFVVSVLVVGVAVARRMGWATEIGMPLPPGTRPSLFSGRLSGLFGNSGYLAGYLVVALAVGSWLLVTARSLIVRLMVAVGLLVDLAGLLLTSQRAALGGLAVGGLFALGAYAWLTSRRSHRVGAVAGLLLIVSVGGLARLEPDAGWVGAVPGLRRMATTTLEGGAVRDRLLAWQSAYEGVRGNPATGVGFENFKIVFDRHFNPEWYRYVTGPERVWDRAHNAFVGAFVAGGLPAGLAYGALFAVLLWGIFRAARAGRIGPAEASVLAGAVLAYAGHLFFWFEDYSSFPLLIAVSAFAAQRAWQPRSKDAEPPVPSRRERGLSTAVVVLGVAGVAAASWWHHFDYLRSARQVRLAHDAGAGSEVVDHFERAVVHRPPGEDEVPSEYARLVGDPPPDALRKLRAANPSQLAPYLRRGLEGSFSALSDAIEENPQNSRLLMNRARVYLTTSLIQEDTTYYRNAGRDVQKAIKLAPNRITYYQVLADWYLFGQRPDLALGAMQEAARRYARLPETQFYLARAYAAAGQPREAVDHLVRAAELGHGVGSAVMPGVLAELSGTEREEARRRICAALGERGSERQYCG